MTHEAPTHPRRIGRPTKQQEIEAYLQDPQAPDSPRREGGDSARGRGDRRRTREAGHRVVSALAVTNLRARIIRALEAIEDGDVAFAATILSDLLAEWSA